MEQLAVIALASWLAGLTAFVGAAAAKFAGAAGGGILYLVFQDIAPQAPMRRHWAPPLGAVMGFMVGMIGKQLLG